VFLYDNGFRDAQSSLPGGIDFGPLGYQFDTNM
jgi:hypothetical protein